jgi:hypothetical protein
METQTAIPYSVIVQQCCTSRMDALIGVVLLNATVLIKLEMERTIDILVPLRRAHCVHFG